MSGLAQWTDFRRLCDKARLTELYRSGLSQREIGRLFGVRQTTVQKVMRRWGIGARPAGPPPQGRGPDSHNWRGDQAAYAAFHKRVEAARGRPSRCEDCGASGPPRRYEWANLTGHYEDVADYRRMCMQCHRHYDAGRAE